MNVVEKVAVIVETRKYKALSFVLKNVMSNLNAEWKLQIFHGLNNLEYIKDIIENDNFLKDIKDRIIFNNLNIENISQDDYSYQIMLNEDFWNKCIGDTILIFQSDSMLCPNSKFDISEFEHFDYIGGYWGGPIGPNGHCNTEYTLDEYYPVVMNGGLSLRKKQFMLDIIKNELKPYLEQGGNPCEDYFVTACVRNMPTARQVRNFSIDCGYISPLDMETPFGVHKPWGVLPKKGHGKYYNEIKKVCSGVEKLESLQEESNWWSK